MNQAVAPSLHLHRVRVLPQLPAISLEFPPGIHALVTSRSELAQALLECMAGLRSPLGSPWNVGSVRLGDNSPLSSPELRASFGVTLPFEPALPNAGTLRSALEPLLALRQQYDSLSTVSASSMSFISDLLNRSPQSLTNAERRRVTLGLALSLRAPQALLLYDPLCGLSLDEASHLLTHLRELVEQERVVICVTPTLINAQRLSSNIRELGAGVSASDERSYCIFCSEPQKLAEYLQTQPGCGEEFDDIFLPENQPHRVYLRLKNQSAPSKLLPNTQLPDTQLPKKQKLVAALANAPGVIYQFEHLAPESLERA